MAFDAGMVKALALELDERLSGARIDKIQQPEKEQIVMTLRADRENVRLSLSSGANNPRINITSYNKENPVSAPMFCMLLRKYLLGGKIVSIEQYDFERVIEIKIECRDEMRFLCVRYLIIEIMGKYSNIIFCDENKKIMGAIKTVDFTTSSKRQVISGMKYEYPPKQDKLSPISIDEKGFVCKYNEASKEKQIGRFITDSFLGLSLLVGNEIAYRTTGHVDGRLSDCSAEHLWSEFNKIVEIIKGNAFEPYLIKNKDELVEFTFMPIKQYGGLFLCEKRDSFSCLIDEYFRKRDTANHMKQISAGLFKYLSNNESRITKKTAIHNEEIKKATDNLKFKSLGDMITANIYMLKRGDAEVELFDYNEDPPTKKTVQLDTKLTPAQNAQRYYKKYNKAKKTIEHLTDELKKDATELEYINSVLDSLSRAEGEKDLDDIRAELKLAGYNVKSKSNPKKRQKNEPLEFKTQNGYTVLCGKNNLQNDNLTFKTASKLDYWFHVKNIPGSHCILLCNGEEPPEVDFTEAAIIAATFSKASAGENVAVDYTYIKNVKKLAASKPGLVTYSTNWTAYVSPNEELCKKLRAR